MLSKLNLLILKNKLFLICPINRIFYQKISMKPSLIKKKKKIKKKRKKKKNKKLIKKILITFFLQK